MITIPHGPQFSSPISRFGVLLLLFLIAMSMYYTSQERLFIAIPGWLTSVLTVILFLDFQGVQIDLEKQRIRRYKSFLGIRSGRWQPLEKFNDRLELKWERVKYRTSGTPHLILLSERGTTSDSYCVYLCGEVGARFLLGELGSHKAARSFMLRYAKVLDLPVKDFYRERLESAAKRRSEIEARRSRIKR